MNSRSIKEGSVVEKGWAMGSVFIKVGRFTLVNDTMIDITEWEQ